jgi:hypothetical protein
MKSTWNMIAMHTKHKPDGIVVIISLIVLSTVDAALPRFRGVASFRRPPSIRGGGSQDKPVILVVGSLNAGLITMILVGMYHHLPFN